MRSFSQDTVVERIDDGRYRASLLPEWDIAGNANGGFMLALAARAMAMEVERPDPVTVTAHYLAPGKPGSTEIQVQPVKQGKRFAVASATMLAAGRPLLQLLGTFGDLGGAVNHANILASGVPEMPPPEACVHYGDQAGMQAMYRNIELRVHPEDAWFDHGVRSGTMRVRGWMRFPGDAEVDVMGLLLAADAFPPPVFNAGSEIPIVWVPTLEFTVHVRARPAAGWLRAAFATRFVSGGFVEADGEIWDETGTLVAQSRQIALSPLRDVEGVKLPNFGL